MDEDHHLEQNLNQDSEPLLSNPYLIALNKATLRVLQHELFSLNNPDQSKEVTSESRQASKGVWLH